jgi:hypothetical protein
MPRVLVGVIAALITLSGCASQGPTPCQLQSPFNGPYTVKLTNTGAATANCPAVFGDQWFTDAYAAGLVVVRSAQVDLPDPPDGTSPVYGKGHFSSVDPDSNDLCTVLALDNPFTGPGGSTYTVQNFAFLSTALYVGTELKADVQYTVGAETCNYTAQGINPSFQCATTHDCSPFTQPFNSGINNLYDQGCNLETWATDLTGDPATGICFFNKEFPSLGGFHE